MIPNNVYDVLKWVTTVVLPALGTLYFALSGIWGFPYGEAVVGTITAIVTFLGTILNISSANYKKSKVKTYANTIEFLEDINNEQHSE